MSGDLFFAIWTRNPTGPALMPAALPASSSGYLKPLSALSTPNQQRRIVGFFVHDGGSDGVPQTVEVTGSNPVAPIHNPLAAEAASGLATRLYLSAKPRSAWRSFVFTTPP
jgi:hypothetical protein